MAHLRPVLELMVNPFLMALVILGLAIVLLSRTGYLHFAQHLLILVFVTLLVLSTGWLPKFMTQRLESDYPLVKVVDPSIRWVVVLSGGQSVVAGMPVNDLLSGTSIKRLLEGIRLLRDLPHARLVLSGGGTLGEQKEAVLLEQLTHWFAIPKERIVLESDSLNTADQARALVATVHNEPFYLVTSAIHLPRAMRLCQHQGLHPIAAPTDFTFFWQGEGWAKMIVPNSYNVYYFNIAMHEVLGRMWGFLARLI